MSSVLDEISDILAEVLGEEFLLDVQVCHETSFSDDLALESIEFVELSEKLQERYGERVNLAAFIADMDIDEIMAMTVGQLADYIEAELAAAAT
jgi:acyl carrier protein